jgi:hypothetical protein
MRLDGLHDEPRVGADRTISDDQVEAVIVRTPETKAKDETHWGTRSMAKKAGMSRHGHFSHGSLPGSRSANTQRRANGAA